MWQRITLKINIEFHVATAYFDMANIVEEIVGPTIMVSKK